VGIPVLVGSGVTPDNVARYPKAQGFIVGSSVKKGGRWTDPLDVVRAQEIAGAFAKSLGS
jgi:uncharacterized protein